MEGVRVLIMFLSLSLITCFFQTIQEFCGVFAKQWNGRHEESQYVMLRGARMFASDFEELIKQKTILLLYTWTVYRQFLFKHVLEDYSERIEANKN